MFGKSQVQDALTIDMRDINYCHITDDQTSAKVGGGILFRDLIQALSEHDLAAATGTAPFIGYVRWSTYGG